MYNIKNTTINTAMTFACLLGFVVTSHSAYGAVGEAAHEVERGAERGAVRELDNAQYQSQLARIVPDTLDEHIVYPTNHVTLELDPVHSYVWESVEIPSTWFNQGYYYEIWDSHNKPVPQFQARILIGRNNMTDGSAYIDLSAIDASLYPKIRLIIFKPDATPELPYVTPIRFYYSQQPSYTLFILMGCIGLHYALFGVAAVYYKIRWRDIWLGTKKILYPTITEPGWRQIVVYGWITMVWASVFGIALGNVAGGLQIAYVLIKLPFLLLGALCGTVISLVVLSQLLNLHRSGVAIITQAMQLVAITAIALASFSGLIVFYTYLPQNHDVILVTVMICLATAGGLAAYRLGVWLQSVSWLVRIVIIGLWIMMYGMVFLQLGWQMRPWVGVLDPITNSVPFVRSSSGNVFIEVLNTIERSH